MYTNNKKPLRLPSQHYKHRVPVRRKGVFSFKLISYSILPQGLVAEELYEFSSRQQITVKEYSDEQPNISNPFFFF